MGPNCWVVIDDLSNGLHAELLLQKTAGNNVYDAQLLLVKIPSKLLLMMTP